MPLIYLVTRLATGEKYVGMTITKLSTRWANHLSNSKKGFGPLSRAILTDGRDGFRVEKIEDVADIAGLADRERHWIAVHDCVAPKGLNANAGGAPGFRGRTAQGDRIRALAQQAGVTYSTAGRWVREGRDERASCGWPARGNRHSPAYAKWHSMRQRGGVCTDWQAFSTFERYYAEAGCAGRQLRRRDKSSPWGPDNCYTAG